VHERDGFQLAPPDRRRMWKNLALTMSQASTLTGVSERQIQHWMDRGYITPATPGTRKLSGESIDTIVLILQARGAGIPLRRAVVMAREFLRLEASGKPASGIDPTALQEIRDMLTAARTGIDAVQQMIHDLEVNGANARAR